MKLLDWLKKLLHIKTEPKAHTPTLARDGQTICKTCGLIESKWKDFECV